MGNTDIKHVAVVMPALNEAATIAKMVKGIPRMIPGAGQVSVIVVDDGSTDETAMIAKKSGARMVISYGVNLGVSAAIRYGLEAALDIGADVICLIDSDGQFTPSEIPLIVKPILDEKADLVIGTRFHKGNSLSGLSYPRFFGNMIVAKVIEKITSLCITDAESGFRAISRRAAEKLDLIGYLTHTHDMLLDSWARGYRMIEVPVSVKYFKGRNSRAVTNIVSYSIGILGLISLKLTVLFYSRLRNPNKFRA